SYISLLPYPRSRYLANHALLSTCDHLAKLYSSQASPLVWLRSTGLEAINELESVKRLLMGGAGAATQGNGSAWGTVAAALDGLAQVRDVAGLAVGTCNTTSRTSPLSRSVVRASARAVVDRRDPRVEKAMPRSPRARRCASATPSVPWGARALVLPSRREVRSQVPPPLCRAC
ncbi:hypothetical protein JCM21900_003248, partial [Sporobolomyces salmonicolor]